MATRNWTDDQKKVIETRNAGILVSAAAGSGKTAVLIERILARILTDPDPIDLDELLVVTFTRAAASEMRERISAAIDARLDGASPQEAERLLRESQLLPAAEISTIDSFCRRVVAEHYAEIDLDPSFRQADEAELKILIGDVLQELLEDRYGMEDPAFRRAAEHIAPGKNDKSFSELIETVYRYGESFPDPEAWLARAEEIAGRPLADQPIMDYLRDYSCKMIAELERMAEEALAIIQSPEGPVQYEDALQEDLLFAQTLAAAADDTTKVESLLRGYSPKRLGTKAPKGVVVSEEKKEDVKARRKAFKDLIDGILDTCFYAPIEEMEADYALTREDILTVLGLVREFRSRLMEAKQKKNILDFSDVEHYALEILKGRDGQPTEAAAEFRAQYREIMIDEYQDSNYLQEDILGAITRNDPPNLFMVGDVKQSIYAFRQARPDLFMKKYERFADVGTPGAQDVRITLGRNFRSRPEVLSSVNAVFRKVMHADYGDIEYDDRAALYPGRVPDADDFWEQKPLPARLTEVLLTEKSEGTGEVRTDERELEALLIAGRIRELAAEGVPYGDMVILLRTMSKWSETFQAVLQEAGIPAVASTRTGYFSAWEVQVMLSMLQILENPRQDIPLMTVLVSPIGGLSPEEVAGIRIAVQAAGPDGLWEAVQLAEEDAYQGEGRETYGPAWDRLKERLDTFLAFYRRYREAASWLSVAELIRKIAEETGFLSYIQAMPGGTVRRANILMLVHEAAAYAETSMHGLLHFVRYIEQLKNYEVDFGEADGREDLDAVRIMSVHGSKGLEFPVVFVAGGMKTFNFQDSNKNFILHPDYGIGMTAIMEHEEPGMPRTKVNTLPRRMLQKITQKETLSEEMRILYVAMTRAKEHLILTGVTKEMDKLLAKWRMRGDGYLAVTGARCFLDFVMPAVFEDLEEELGDVRTFGSGKYFTLRRMSKEEIIRKEQSEMSEESKGAKQFRDRLMGLPEDETGSHAAEETVRVFSWKYPYEAVTKQKGKYSVSELKRLHLAPEEAGEALFEDSPRAEGPDDGPDEGCEAEERTERTTEHPAAGSAEAEIYIPTFARETEEPEFSGSDRGTLVHDVMRRISFREVQTTEMVRDFLAERVASGGMTEQERGVIHPRTIARFFRSEIAERMIAAEREGKLFRETPFVIGHTPAEWSEETVLVQGIIDAWFYEGDEIVLLDYKTDRVFAEDGAEVLMQKYRVQLDYYREALERLTGKRVKESYLYSFTLGTEIREIYDEDAARAAHGTEE